MSNIYTVKLPDDRNIMHVQAKDKNEARRVALEGVTVTKLDGAAILSLHKRGAGIVDADTGKLVGEEAIGTGDGAQTEFPVDRA